MDLGYRAVDADNHYYETLDACTRHLAEGVPPARRAGRAAGHALAAARGREAVQVHPQPHLRPDHRGRLHGPDVPRPDPRGRRPALAHEGRAAARRVPGPRRAPRGDGRAGPRSRAACSRRSRSASSRCCATTSRRPWRRSTRSTSGSTRTGASRTRTASSRVPMLSLADPDAAIAELDWVLERGARMVHLRPAPVPTANGKGRSFGHPDHDPVWARLAEADVPVAFHLGDSGYEMFAGAWGARDWFEPFRGGVDVLSKLVVSDRPIHDTIGSMVVDGVFDRHPTLRAASIENGSDWVRAAGEAAAEAGEPDAVGVPREPARHDPRARVGHAVLRGGHAQARRPHRRRQGALRLRLAPRRGARPTRSTSSRSCTRSPTTRSAW